MFYYYKYLLQILNFCETIKLLHFTLLLLSNIKNKGTPAKKSYIHQFLKPRAWAWSKHYYPMRPKMLLFWLSILDLVLLFKVTVEAGWLPHKYTSTFANSRQFWDRSAPIHCKSCYRCFTSNNINIEWCC